jgi:hypothetical protein
MKLSSLVLLGTAAALPFGIYLTYRIGNPPVAATASVSQPVSMTEYSATASDEETKGSLTVIDSARTTAEGIYKDISALRQELALLRAEISALQRHQSRMAATVAVTPEEDPANDLRRGPAARAEADRQYQEQMKIVEANFQQERIDSRWSSDTAAAVQEAVASDDTAQAALRNINCRSNTCRVEMAGDNTGELAKFMPLFVQQLGETLPNVTANQVDDGDGGKTLILYMSRETD